MNAFRACCQNGITKRRNKRNPRISAALRGLPQRGPTQWCVLMNGTYHPDLKPLARLEDDAELEDSQSFANVTSANWSIVNVPACFGPPAASASASSSATRLLALSPSASTILNKRTPGSYECGQRPAVHPNQHTASNAFNNIVDFDDLIGLNSDKLSLYCAREYPILGAQATPHRAAGGGAPLLSSGALRMGDIAIGMPVAGEWISPPTLSSSATRTPTRFAPARVATFLHAHVHRGWLATIRVGASTCCSPIALMCDDSNSTGLESWRADGCKERTSSWQVDSAYKFGRIPEWLIQQAITFPLVDAMLLG